MYFLLFLFLLVAPINAQEATSSATPSPSSLFTQYQQDYLYQYDLYQQTYTVYLEKKQVYSKYGTVTSQNDQFLAAKEAIVARNRMYKSYLMALRVMLDSYKSADFTQTEIDQTDLKNHEIWFSEQIPIVSGFDNSRDLQTWVDNFQAKYRHIQLSVFTSLVQNEANLRWLTLTQAQSLFKDMQNNLHLKPDSQQWVQSFTDKSSLATTAINNAILSTKKLQYPDRFSNFYPAAKKNLDLSRTYLSEISNDLKLIIIKFYQP